MTSSNLDNLDRQHTVTGLITSTLGTLAVLTTNDGSATLTATGTGVYTVNFGDTFVSAPTVTANLVQATYDTTAVAAVQLASVTTSLATFNISKYVQNATITARADAGDIQFIAVGTRNN